MRLCVIQMDMRLGESAYNFAHAEALLRARRRRARTPRCCRKLGTPASSPPTICRSGSDRGGEAVKALCAPLARELNMNIVAGSVSDRRGGRVYNTAYVFDRQGARLAAYDKTHLFTPMGEHEHYAAGDHLTTFFARRAQMQPAHLLRPPLPRAFPHAGASGRRAAAPARAVAAARRYHWETLTAARAIEKPALSGRLQLLRHGGRDCVRRRVAHLGPRGELLAAAGVGEEIVTAALDFSVLAEVRNSINVFHDRRPELYRL